ncbi:hypothetical protein [Comamonas sp.]|uniref:hypothetical protein n=1 Tax=Comamonas sp. TaxID=34028 RepID=UPI0012C1886A|nr:hypothetical protein [Comamonas sp.]MPS93332.1 hypothetical protein [Comamonas sp.]
MKETGLMFKAPLVRTILSGQKTQTRRICKQETVADDTFMGGHYLKLNDGMNLAIGSENVHIACPTGGPGDRIYVRETFVQGYEYDPVIDRLRTCDDEGNNLPMKTWFRATEPCLTWSDEDGWETKVPWKPAIHMPKALARIWLEITGVRVERLQQITEADCVAEGTAGGHGSIPDYAYSATPLEHFRHIWESTGGDWAANPWVWVIDFKRITHSAL